MKKWWQGLLYKLEVWLYFKDLGRAKWSDLPTFLLFDEIK